MDAIFSPRSVAVIGASDDPQGIGHRILANLIQGGFRGLLAPVNLRGVPVLGRPAFRSILEVPEAIDLAVVSVPAAAVESVVDQCGRKGVKGLVVISAGFRETGPEGAQREERLRGLVERYHLRMIGPNCMGVLNASDAVRLNATFAPTRLRAGTSALMTQSGALGVALLEHAADLHLGIARFASMGNKTNVSSNDLLMLWEDDPEVREILMYLENFGNPRNFVRIARRVGRKKPILLVKSGRSVLGAKAASSHTGALAQGERLVEALLDQCGALRLNTVEQLMDCALAVALQPLPRGNRVGIVTNSGGPAIMAVDALDASGLRPAAFASATLDRLRPLLPNEASFSNPLDLLAGGGPEHFDASIRALVEDAGVDAVLVICTPIVEDDLPLARAIAAAVGRTPTKPVTVVFFGQAWRGQGFHHLIDAGIPAYSFPESAVTALGAMNAIVEARRRPEGKLPDVAVDHARLERALAGPRSAEGWMRQHDALNVLESYGVPVAPHAFAATRDEALIAAQRIGYPVVLKVESDTILHKSDVGGIRLHLETPNAVVQAFDEILRRANAAGHNMSGALVMAQARPGREFLIGATQDDKFGPLVAIGLGGIYAEMIKDVVFRLAPLTDEDAMRMLRSLKAYALLEGVRGEPPRDVAALRDALLRIARLAADHTDILELDLNPFMVHEAGAGGVAVDARLRLKPPSSEGRR